jgi:hypothetical protein
MTRSHLLSRCVAIGGFAAAVSLYVGSAAAAETGAGLTAVGTGAGSTAVGTGAGSTAVGTGADSGPVQAAASGPNPEQGLVLGPWIFYPSMLVGAVYNSNVYNTTFDKRGEFGIRLVPSFVAIDDAGIQKTTVYGNLDAQIFPGASKPAVFESTSLTSPNSLQARLGISHVYQPTPDLKITAIGDFTRQFGLFGSGFLAGVGLPVIVSAPAFTTTPQYYNQFTGYVSVEKQLNERNFVAATGSVQGIVYDQRNTSLVFPAVNSTTDQNNVAVQGSLRFGYRVVPSFYVFGEAGGNTDRYKESALDSNGLRTIIGVGSEQIALFKGEIYGGYQWEWNTGNAYGTVSSPAFGARLFYSPTEYFTVAARIDQTLGAAASITTLTGVLPASGTKDLTAQLQSVYSLSPYWTATARVGHQWIDYSETNRKSNGWVAGAGVSYNFWRNLNLTLDYQITKSTSNIVGTGYSAQLITLGASYHY